jgi:chromosome segregation ATPase
VHGRASTLIAAALLVVAPAVGARAAPVEGGRDSRRPEVADEVRTLREQVSEASADEAVLLERLDDAQGRRAQLEATVARLDGVLASSQAEVDAAEARLEAVQAEFVRTQTKLALTAGELAAARNRLR